MKEIRYWDLIGVSSHELFHTWNVKNIRPIEMMPYDFSRENYTRLGYVAEGVTTYYGDLMAYRAKVFSDFEFFKTIHQLFMRHFHNYGRFNLSVADSSFDTWLDGYEKGIPDRKVSIYTEGALCSLMLDLSIRKQSGNAKSLDDVLKKLYEDFGKQGKGYSEEDYQKVIEQVSGHSYQEFFDKYYNGTEDYEPLLTELLEYVGLEIKNIRSRLYFENRFGFKVTYMPGGSAKISDIAPDSIADKAGLQLEDEIVSINGIRLQSNLKEWCKYFEEEEVTITVNKTDDMAKIKLVPSDERYYRSRWPNKMANVSDEQKANFLAWTGREF
jgi:predicted metalloprotease with PDZ domain